MCMTLDGATGPESALCGDFGTCVDNVCVCENNFIQSLDWFLVLGPDSAAKEIHENLTQTEGGVEYGEFYSELLRQTPCSRYLPLHYSIFAAIITTATCAFIYSMYSKKTRHFKQIHLCRSIAYFFITLDGILKVSLPEDSFYPYDLGPSIVIAFLIFFVQRVDMEGFFQRQVKYSASFEVIIFAGFYLIPPIIIEVLYGKSEFEFKDLEISQIIIIFQNILGLFYFIYIFFISRTLFSALLTDLEKLLELWSSSKENTVSLREETSTNQTSSKNKKMKLQQLIKRAKWTRRLLTLYSVFWMFIFTIPTLVPVLRPVFQYVAPMMSGIFFPIIALHMY
eukprot:snap_masked-scaffold_2-processed-gene-6.12-mRNA-1 protein AED:1.00 eAED:1.00 QI:0/0/0/0/1/1/2/0/337